VYARALLRLEEQKSARLQLAMALKGRPGTLLDRVNQILGEDGKMESKMTSGVRVAVAAAIVMGLLLAPKLNSAVAAPLVVAARPVVAQVASALPSPATRMIGAQAPVVHVQVTPTVVPEVAVATPDVTPTPIVVEADGEPQAEEKTPTTNSTPKGMAYLDGMRAAGYPLDLNNDLDTLVSLKSLGVTPEYAKGMANIGLGKPDVHELISLKSLGVTPEYVAGLKQSGIGPKDFHEVVTEKALGVTPEYATAMKQLGFGEMDVQALISLKAQGMTPEYGAWLKKQFPQATIDQLRRAAVFHLDDKFLGQAKAHGFSGTDMDKLLRLKMSGLLDE
jgi:hypothetical protein